jgi:hypothetical protein
MQCEAVKRDIRNPYHNDQKEATHLEENVATK